MPPRKKSDQPTKAKKPIASASSPRWKNRIVGHAQIDPRKVVPNDMNWRQHPALQQRTMGSILDRIGWVNDLLVNRRTGKLLDGHLRLSLALERGESTVPVKYVDLSEEEELDVLLNHDLVGTLAQADAAMLRTLRDEVADAEHLTDELTASEAQEAEELLETTTRALETISRTVGKVHAYSTGKENSSESLASTPDSLPGVFDLKETLDYEWGEHPFDIPAVLRDKCIACPEPISTWVSPDVPHAQSSDPRAYALTVQGNNNVGHARTAQALDWSRTVLCTHTDDEHLLPLWYEQKYYAAKILNRGIYACISPEISVGGNWPKAERIYNVFRNRWLARYWQECGIKIIPSVSHLEVESDSIFLYAGLPKNLPCISCQVHSNSGGEVDEVDAGRLYSRSLRHLVNELKPQSLLVYGSPSREKFIEQAKLPKSLHIISVDNYSTVRYEYLHRNRGTADRIGTTVRKQSLVDKETNLPASKSKPKVVEKNGKK